MTRLLITVLLICGLLVLVGEKSAARSLANFTLELVKWVFIIGIVGFIGFAIFNRKK